MTNNDEQKHSEQGLNLVYIEKSKSNFQNWSSTLLIHMLLLSLGKGEHYYFRCLLLINKSHSHTAPFKCFAHKFLWCHGPTLFLNYGKFGVRFPQYPTSNMVCSCTGVLSPLCQLLNNSTGCISSG